MKHMVLDLANSNDVRAIRHVMENEPVVFLVGSAVSSFAPSGLPSGQSIVSQVSEFLLHDEQIERDSERYRLLAEFVTSSAFEHLLEHYPKPRELKAYFSSEFAKAPFNQFHEVITSMSAKTSAPIITTNYDELFERAFQARGSTHDRIVSENDLQKRNSDFPTVFKIHGCVSNPQSIILRMSEEGMLAGWKYDLFLELLHNRSLIVVGYSGQDFEICPAIQTANIKALYWNALWYDEGLTGASANLKHLLRLERKPFECTILSGDMARLLGVPRMSPESKQSNILSFFSANLSKEQAADWRATFFDSIAAPHAVERQVRKLPSNKRPRAESGRYYRLGKYQSSHQVLFASGDEHGYGANKNISRLLDRSFKYRNSGLSKKAKKACLEARQIWATLPTNEQGSLEDQILWSTVLNLPIDYDGVWEAAAVRLEDLRHGSGDWGGLYNLRIHLKQRGREDIVSQKRFYELMNAREGYEHIGNISAYVDEFSRDSYGKDQPYDAFAERIHTAELFQLYPNLYKCCYAALCSSGISGPRLRFMLFAKCIFYMWKCEYSARMRTYVAFWAMAALMFPSLKKPIL